jgi:prevent-host-death family protein
VTGRTKETGSADDVAVYRLYDSDETLLYVGIANDPKRRFHEHEVDKEWWPEVATREITWFSSREKAWEEELRAIRAEHPRHNDYGVRWPRHHLGEPPAEVMNMTEFRAYPHDVVDRVAATGKPVVVTRQQKPLVVIVPYFDEQGDAWKPAE